MGGGTRLGRTRLFGSVFYSKLDDALVTIRTAQDLNRRENIGSADYCGAELGVDAQFSPTLQAGLNYSYIHRSFDIRSALPGVT
ncbi:hypothetical protein [Aurantiacibacter atlanticus]|uniref:hypothetical protein n=1 Tax=Aurantiacibacter atlanticus TaxID=1648404 RepID=UPI003AAC35D4